MHIRLFNDANVCNEEWIRVKIMYFLRLKAFTDQRQWVILVG